MKCDSSHWGLENGENEKGNWKIEEEEEEEEEEASMFLTFFVKGRMFVNFIKLSKVRIVEVGHVWLELPSPIILLNQIQAVLGNPIQLGL